MSQCAAILAVLQDGQPHSVREIHQRAGFSRLNSRVSELRKRGYRISCEYVGGSGAEAYVYTLDCQALPGEPVRSSPRLTADSLTESGAASVTSEVFAGQLSLEVAAA